MPTPVQSFIAEHARGDRKIFDTLDACLFEETKALHEDLIHAVTFLCFVDGVPIDSQFDKLRAKFTALRDKAREWEAARAARKAEFEQRAAADLAQQEAYWAKFYENKDKIARAIARDVALKEQAQRRADSPEPNSSVLDVPEISSQHIDPKPADTDRPVCDICGKPMIRKTGKFGRFLACSGYPACKHTRPFAEPAEPPAENPVDMRRAA